MTGDTVVKRAKLSGTPSSSSSSHEVAPNLLGSLSETENPATREHAVKKYRSDADMEISVIEALTDAKLEVDRALDTANKTLHRLLEENPLFQRRSPMPQKLNSIRDERVYTEVYGSEADAKIVSGKWVLKPHNARYVLRRRRTKTLSPTRQ